MSRSLDLGNSHSRLARWNEESGMPELIDRKPRLELSFSVDADRCLRVTVDDLKTGQRLLANRQVVRLV